MTLTRRDWLISVSTLALVPPRAVLAEAVLAAPFSGSEKQTLSAAVERLLPGAKEAGIPDYLAFWLSKKPFEGLKRFITAGVRYLDKSATRQFGGPFVVINDNQKDQLLKALNDGEHQLRHFDGRLFFRKLMDLTLEGYLSDPRYGGNRDRAGWRFIGLPDGLRSCWWNPNGARSVLRPDDGFTD